MPDDPPRRIIIEKSSTVRRRYQRSNKRFKFSAEEIARIERELKAEKRAKELREKEDKRLAKKRKKAEKEARDREERKRLGLPDPTAPKVPSSQPLLSAFLAKRPAPVEEMPVVDLPAEDSPYSPEDTPVEDTPTEDTPELHSPQPEPELEPKPESDHEPLSPIEEAHPVLLHTSPRPLDVPQPTSTETKPNEHEDVAIAEVESAAGDTEIDSDFDDWNEELERELSYFQDAGVLEDSKIPDAGHDTRKDTLQTMCTDKDDDEFSNCSAFDDEEIMKEAAAIEAKRSAQNTPAQNTPDIKYVPPSNAPVLQPLSSNHPKEIANPVASVGESFRDETADILEEAILNGASFSEFGGSWKVI